MPRELRGLEEFRVIVRAARQQAQDVFGADHREQVGLGVAIDGGKKHLSARFDQLRAGADRAGRIGHVFQHFHAGERVVLSGLALRQRFGADFFVVHIQARLEQMQHRHLQRLVRKVDALNARAQLRHGFRQDAAAYDIGVVL